MKRLDPTPDLQEYTNSEEWRVVYMNSETLRGLPVRVKLKLYAFGGKYIYIIVGLPS